MVISFDMTSRRLARTEERAGGRVGVGVEQCELRRRRTARCCLRRRSGRRSRAGGSPTRIRRVEDPVVVRVSTRAIVARAEPGVQAELHLPGVGESVAVKSVICARASAGSSAKQQQTGCCMDQEQGRRAHCATAFCGAWRRVPPAGGRQHVGGRSATEQWPCRCLAGAGTTGAGRGRSGRARRVSSRFRANANGPGGL